MFFGSNPIKPQLSEVEFVHKDIDHSTGLFSSIQSSRHSGNSVLWHAICPLNEALHPIPHSSARITAGESHEALRFHTARIKSGLRNQSAQCPFYPQ